MKSEFLSTTCWPFVFWPQPSNCGSDGKESACNVGDLGSIPGSRRSPGEGNGYPLQYSGLENSMDRGARQATVHGVAKSQKRLSDFHFTLLPTVNPYSNRSLPFPVTQVARSMSPTSWSLLLPLTTPVFHLIVCKMGVYHYVYSFWFYVYKPVCRTSSASLSSTSSRKPSLTTIYPTEVSHPLGLTINTITLFLYPCLFIT